MAWHSVLSPLRPTHLVNAGGKIRGADYVRTGRMPKHEETEGLFSGFGGSGGRDRVDADRRSMAGPGRSFRAAAG